MRVEANLLDTHGFIFKALGNTVWFQSLGIHFRVHSEHCQN
jgi:hypothetical protein